VNVCKIERGPNEPLLRRFYAIRELIWQLDAVADPYRGRSLRALLTAAGSERIVATTKYFSYGTDDRVRAFGRPVPRIAATSGTSPRRKRTGSPLPATSARWKLRGSNGRNLPTRMPRSLGVEHGVQAEQMRGEPASKKQSGKACRRAAAGVEY
jgi:hypothetical protein